MEKNQEIMSDFFLSVNKTEKDLADYLFAISAISYDEKINFFYILYLVRLIILILQWNCGTDPRIK